MNPDTETEIQDIKGNHQKEDFFGDHAMTPVKPHEKRASWDIALVTAGFCIAMSGLFAGAAMGAGLTLGQTILAALIGNAILTVYGGLIGAAGAKHGVSTTMLSRHAFGRQGAKVIGALWAVSLLGWFAVQTGFFGMTVDAMIPNGGFLTSPKVAALWGGLLMIFYSYFGYKGLSIISKIAIPAIVILSIWGIVAAVGKSGGFSNLLAITPDTPGTLAQGIVLAVGSFSAGAVVQADITRYAKTKKTAWGSTIAGYFIGNTFAIIAGAITFMATNTGDLPAAMISLGLGVPAMIILIAAQWTTNDNNLYSSSLGVSNIIPIKKGIIVAICGLVATFFGFLGIADHFEPFLNILGVFVPPVAGILIADYYIVKKQNYEYGPGTVYSQYSWTAFAAWIIASIFGYLLTVGIPSVNSIVIAFLSYLALEYLFTALNIKTKIGSQVEKETGF